MMTRAEKRRKNFERWNTILGNLEKFDADLTTALEYTPSCLQTKPSTDMCNEIKDAASAAVETTKEMLNELIKNTSDVISAIKSSGSEPAESEVAATSTSDDNIIDVEPTALVVISEEPVTIPKETNVSEKDSNIKTEAKKAVAEKVEAKEAPAEVAKVEKAEAKEAPAEVAKVVKAEAKEAPAVKADAKNQVGDNSSNKEQQHTEQIKDEYEFNSERAQTELMALNKLNEARMQFDHQQHFVNHMKAVECYANATQNLVVAWAASKGYEMFDTTEPIIKGDEFKPYTDRLQFLFEKGEINTEQFNLLKRRVERHVLWDYYSLLPDAIGVEELYDRYFYAEYPWSKDDAKLASAMKKAQQVNIDYLNSLKQKKQR